MEHFIILTDDRSFSTSLPSAHNYEDLLSGASDVYSPVKLDENGPCRIVLHLGNHRPPQGGCLLPPGNRIALDDGKPRRTQWPSVSAMWFWPSSPCSTPIAGECPYTATMVGAKQVLTGVRPDPEAICRLFESEKVTLSLGVPTIWIGVWDYLETVRQDLRFLQPARDRQRRSAVPISLIEAYKERLGVNMVQAYGMTEATPVISYKRLWSHLEDAPEDEQRRIAASPGLSRCQVWRCGWSTTKETICLGTVCSVASCFQRPLDRRQLLQRPRSEETFIDGWYHSGDIASVDPNGYIQIGDRVKDIGQERR